MTDKVYIPNLVVNEISEDLIDHVADEVGAKLTIDSTNLAKLNEGNIFKEGCTFEKDCLFGGQVVISKLKSASNPNVMEPKEWATLTDNDIPTKKQIVDITDTKVSKTGPETIEGVKTFASIPLCSQTPTNGNQLANKDYVDSVAGSGDSIPLSISNQMATYDATTLQSVKWDFGNNTYSVFGSGEMSFNAPNSLNFNLDTNGTLTMSTKMISELKRLLGIQ